MFNILFFAATFCATYFTQSAHASTLILIGGGTRPPEALRHFVQSKKAGPIYVLPWGTSEPDESFATIKQELIDAGAKVGDGDIICFCRGNFSRQDSLKLAEAGAIYFPGGDQNKIMQKITANKLKPLFHKLFDFGVPFAGTSAGTAIQSDPMITGRDFETAEGLGLLPNFIVDQHFLVRAREERLLKILNANPDKHGFGVDESTSVIIQDSRVFKAVGPSITTLYLRHSGRLKKIPLAHGETFELPNEHRISK